jgi:hypothetical protein
MIVSDDVDDPEPAMTADPDGRGAADDLRSRIEIRDLLARYSVAVDTGELALLRTVFTADAAIDYGAEFATGVGADWFIKYVGVGIPGARALFHDLGTSLVELTGESTARGRTYVVDRCVGGGAFEGQLFTLGGWYLDDFTRTDDGWRISRRTFELVWTEGNRAILWG